MDSLGFDAMFAIKGLKAIATDLGNVRQAIDKLTGEVQDGSVPFNSAELALLDEAHYLAQRAQRSIDSITVKRQREEDET